MDWISVPKEDERVQYKIANISLYRIRRLVLAGLREFQPHVCMLVMVSESIVQLAGQARCLWLRISLQSS
jgi:hypothetical protein